MKILSLPLSPSWGVIEGTKRYLQTLTGESLLFWRVFSLSLSLFPHLISAIDRAEVRIKGFIDYIIATLVALFSVFHTAHKSDIMCFQGMSLFNWMTE